MSSEACESIASRSRGTPRIANRYVKILRDYATVGHDIQSKDSCDAIFESF
jgi:Holliday junction resolvasome RuvABC ATP-dependent DNA helicase subunit